jgi:hypothetical protein
VPKPPVRLAAEDFFPAVQKFNDTVGPLFSELKGRFPLDEHSDSGLNRSLGIFLSYCFRTAIDSLMSIRPDPLSREAWLTATQEIRNQHLLWQSNLKYLRQRNFHYVVMLGYKANGKAEEDEFSEKELAEGWLET